MSVRRVQFTEFTIFGAAANETTIRQIQIRLIGPSAESEIITAQNLLAAARVA